MRSSVSRGILAALAISGAFAIAVVPIASLAQPAPRQLPGNPAAPDRGQYDRADPRALDRRDDRLERRLGFLHSELRITAAQQRLWDDFANVVREETARDRGRPFDRPGDFRGPRNGTRTAPPSIVDRLERRRDGLASQSEHYERLLNAIRPLYAALSDDQKRAADENLFSPERADRGRFGRRYSMGPGFGREFGRGFYRNFDRPYGPFDPPYDSFDRSYRYE